MPCNLKISFQKLLKKIPSRSEIMDVGMPCNYTTSFIKIAATVWVEKGCFRFMKCAYLLSRSTTTRIVELPFTLGRPSMKSVVIVSQVCSGNGIGWRRPAEVVVNDLLRWQVSHSSTNFVISDLIPT